MRRHRVRLHSSPRGPIRPARPPLVDRPGGGSEDRAMQDGTGGRLRTVSPVDGRVLVERPRADEREVRAALAAARGGGRAWRRRSVAERVAFVARAVDAFVARGPAIAEEITRQIGRPIAQSPGEVRGFEERARHMLAIAADALADIVPRAEDGLPPLRAPRAARRGARARAVELPVPHRGERDRAGARRRQHGDPEALRADAARRRASQRSVRRGRPAARRLPASCTATTLRWRA